MNEELRTIGYLAKRTLEKFGLEVFKLHYYVPRQPQRKNRGLMVCFDAITRNPEFFGKQYDNQKRIFLIEVLYKNLFEEFAKLLPEYIGELCLDLWVNLRAPYIQEEAATDKNEFSLGHVDVTTDNDVYYVPFEKLVRSGEIKPGSMFDQYCRKYSLPDILKHGCHHISPDSASVEMLEAICGATKVKSVLEIGAGVGICGRAAERLGIKDLTFADKSPVVCDYLRKCLPYPVIQCDGLEFDFNRRWDLVLMGMPYELNPWFLDKRGRDLADHCTTVVFQSGIPAFFEFEHEWLMRRGDMDQWPWWKREQRIGEYFPFIADCNLDWQLCIVATHNHRILEAIRKPMRERGFTNDPNCTHIKL